MKLKGISGIGAHSCYGARGDYVAIISGDCWNWICADLVRLWSVDDAAGGWVVLGVGPGLAVVLAAGHG